MLICFLNGLTEITQLHEIKCLPWTGRDLKGSSKEKYSELMWCECSRPVHSLVYWTKHFHDMAQGGKQNQRLSIKLNPELFVSDGGCLCSVLLPLCWSAWVVPWQQVMSVAEGCWLGHHPPGGKYPLLRTSHACYICCTVTLGPLHFTLGQII